jgi:ribosome-associated protein
MTVSKNNFKTIAVTAARAGDSKKAEHVRVYDLEGKSPLADFAVLLQAASGPHLEAVEQEVSIKLKQEGVYCLHKDGMRSRNWKVLDYGGVLVHIFDGKAEEFYTIGKLYADNKPVEWQEAPPAPAPVEEKPAEKPAAKKPAAKKPAARKPAVKKPAVKKPAAKKTAAKKPAVKKAAVKKVVAKKPAKKAAKPAKKAAVKKAAKKNSKKK